MLGACLNEQAEPCARTQEEPIKPIFGFFSLILEEETQVSRGLVTELMLPVFIHMAFSKNVRLSPTPPPFRVGRCTLPTLFSKKQPFRGNNVASPNSIFCATLKQGARGRAEAGYQRCRKIWDRGVAKGV